MDPSTVKLTTLQKIKPLIIAINREIPWQFVVFGGLSIYVSIISTTAMGAFFVTPLIDFIVRRCVVGLIVGMVNFFCCSMFYMFIEDKIFPILGKIRTHYEEEALKVKKRVLDDVIDDEILKK